MLSKYFNSYSYLYFSIRVVLGVLMLTTLLSCSPADIAGRLLGGGGINANANVGQNVTQGIDSDVKVDTRRTFAPTTSVRPNARVDKVDQSNTTNINIEPWMLLVIIVLSAGGAIGWVDNVLRWRKYNAQKARVQEADESRR